MEKKNRFYLTALLSINSALVDGLRTADSARMMDVCPEVVAGRAHDIITRLE